MGVIKLYANNNVIKMRSLNFFYIIYGTCLQIILKIWDN